MSPNGNRKLLSNNKRKYEKKQSKKEIELFFDTYFPALSYGFLFLIQSFTDTSITFSIVLAFFSLSVTLSFELNELCTYFKNKLNLLIKMLNFFSPVLFIFVLFLFCLAIYFSINTLFNIPETLKSRLPNILTSITLFFYFISYSYRSYGKREKKSHNKK